MNKLDENAIRSFYTPTTFSRGQGYYKGGKVHNLECEGNIWSAKVIGSEIYTVRIKLDGYDIHDSCNCPAHRSSWDCKHVCATLLAIVNWENSPTRRKGNGTKNARYRLAGELIENLGKMSHEQTKLTAAEDSELKVEFSLKAYTSETYYKEKDIMEIQLKIGIKRLYIVKEIRELLDSISNNTELKFGKHFSYDPSYHVFQQDDWVVIQKLMQFYQAETIYDTNTWRGSSRTGKSMVIPPYAADDLLFVLQHRNCLFEQQDFLYGQLQIDEADLPFSFSLENGMSKEFQLKVTGNTGGHYYEGYGWYANNGKLHKLSTVQQQTIKQFIPLMQSRGSSVIPISAEQVGAFVSQAMPTLKQVGQVKVAKTVSTIIMNPPLRVKMFVEGTSDRIDVKVEYHYDSIVINPITQSETQVNEEQTILIREAEQEQQFMDTFEQSALKVSGNQYYSEDEEDIFGFLYDTLSALEDKVDIFLTPAIKSLIIPTEKIAKVAVDVHSSGNLLEVDFSMDGVDRDKVPYILQSVIEKKRYVRLPNGAFLSLNDEQLVNVADLYKELNDKSIEMIDGKMNLPLYRGLQIDERLTKLDKQQRKFGKSFRQFISAIKSPDEEDYVIPDTLQATLRDYQVTGFQWLKSLAQYQLGGILADDMGLGKTLQCIAYIQSEKPALPVLVVAPASLVYNWKNEFTKFSSELRVAIATGTVQERKNVLEQEQLPDVYITSYHTLRQDIEWYKEQEFHTLILDEAQSIKNYASKIAQAVRAITAHKRFALSGTPIENSLDELWAIFQAIMPGFLHDQKTFRSLEPDYIARLVKPFILRRLKKDVLTELPDKIETVHYSELKKEQKELYLGYLDKIRTETQESLATEGIGKGRIKILAGLTRLRQLCCHPSLFIDNYEGQSGKLEELLEIIRNGQENGRKMLIFSQFSSMLKIIQEKLVQEGQSCFYLDGQTPAKERVQLVDDFNGGAESIFLISLKAGGTGLNLTGADTVILYDLWWNPAIEEQAIGRAHRMGQKNVVQVIKLIAQGTIEEKINELQQSKKELIDQVIQTGETMLSSLSEDDIREILSI
ncbi:DEAD/DEAH box helicase [Sporosarcina sp. FSL K6-3457]|uniref:DEAD/DEAH box helicase n=1 Tax=Sporosarcina sp. FSL K6-3457 TaxID=2978204 RepID=UPI0030FA17F3